MANRWGLPDPVGTSLNAAVYNRLFRAATNQTIAALHAIGAGVLDGWGVTAGTGLAVTVAAGAGIVRHSQYGEIGLATTTQTVVSGLTDNADNYVFAAAVIASALGNPDSRETLVPSFVVQDTATPPDGAILLAKVHASGGSVTVVTPLAATVGNGGLLADLFGNGRVVGSDVALNAPEPPPADSLSIVLPQGGIYVISGTRVQLSADVTIDDVPVSGARFGFLSLDNAGNPEVTAAHWYAIYPTGATLTALQQAGYPCLGKVTADTDSVTAMDATATGRADLIYTEQGLLAALSGGGGGGTALPTYWGGLQKSLSDPTTVDQEIDSKISTAVAGLGSGGGGTTVTVIPRDEVAVNMLHNAMREQLAWGNALDIIPAWRLLLIMPGSGHCKVSDPDSPIDYVNSTLPVDEASGLIG